MKKISRYIYLATYKHDYIYYKYRKENILFLIWRFKFSVIPIYNMRKEQKQRVHSIL